VEYQIKERNAYECLTVCQRFMAKNLPFRLRRQGLETLFVSSSSTTTWVTAWDNVFSGSYVVFAGNKRHLQPLDAFSELLMRPKCICGQGAYSAHLYLLAGGEGARCPSFAAPSSNSFTALGLRPRSSALLASGVHHPRQMDGFVAGCGIARFPCDSTVLVVVVVVVVVFGFITNKQS